MLDHVLTTLAHPVTQSPVIKRTAEGNLSTADGHELQVTDDGYVVALVDDTHHQVGDSNTPDLHAVAVPAAHIAGGYADRHGDDDDMVAARETFLSTGNFAPFVEAVTQAVCDSLDDMPVSDTSMAVVCDLGAGTGYYLAHTLDELNNVVGIGIDVSPPAARKLAAAHKALTAVCADITSSLPLVTESVDVATHVFAPVSPEHTARVLKDTGELVVMYAIPGHLDELRTQLGTAIVTDDDIALFQQSLHDYFEPVAEPTVIRFPMELDAESIATQIAMSPSAQEVDPEVLAKRAQALPEKMTVTAAAAVARYRKRTQ